MLNLSSGALVFVPLTLTHERNHKMSTTAQLASRGGPCTDAGRAKSSQNAITHGLFTTRDFIRPGEDSIHAELAESLRVELAPSGPLELNLVHEIHGAMWRLRRCGQIEEDFVISEIDGIVQDPMQIESTARLQLSVDRARAQAHRLLHKCTAELRKLQTERQFRHEFFDPETDISHLGICDLSSIQNNIDKQLAAKYRRQILEDNARIDAMLAAPLPQPSSFCKTPRNAQCPCNSGQKYKRCCGKNAPPMLHAA